MERVSAKVDLDTASKDMKDKTDKAAEKLATKIAGPQADPTVKALKDAVDKIEKDATTEKAEKATEKATEKTEKAAKKAVETTEKAGESAANKTEKAADKAKAATDSAKDAAADATSKAKFLNQLINYASIRYSKTYI